MNRLPITLVGAGQIGRQYAKRLAQPERACLNAVVDSTAASQEFTAERAHPSLTRLPVRPSCQKPLGYSDLT